MQYLSRFKYFSKIILFVFAIALSFNACDYSNSSNQEINNSKQQLQDSSKVLDDAPYTGDMFVKGSFNDWDSGNKLEYVGNNTYQACIFFEEGVYQFKVADLNWSTIFTLDIDGLTDLPIGETRSMENGPGIGNDVQITITESDDYTFTFTASETNDPTPEIVIVQGDLTPIPPMPDDSTIETFKVKRFRKYPQKGKRGIYSPNSLYKKLAINIPKDEVVQYVFGDNVDGYYDGRTNIYSIMSRYKNKRGYIFSYFASLVNGKLNNRNTEITNTELFPYGVRTNYNNGNYDEMIMHTNQRAVSILVKSKRAKILSLIPKLNLKRTTTTFERVNNVMLFTTDESVRVDGTPAYLAIAADKSYKYQGADLEANPELSSEAKIKIREIKPLFTSLRKQKQFRVTLAFGDTAEEAISIAKELTSYDAYGAQKMKIYNMLTNSYLWTNDNEYNKALMWAKFSSNTFVVDEFGKGIWAGFPWFKDNWGRDTFIVLPGILLANGQFDEAKEVIQAFANLQNTDETDVDYGRIPNRVQGLDNISYNTTDGTPWMVREIYDYIRYTGDIEFANEMYPVVERYIEGALANYVDAQGFLTHNNLATWMDAGAFGDGTAYSARGTRAVEIQALWHTSLKTAIWLANLTNNTSLVERWQTIEANLKTNFANKFWNNETNTLADRIREDDSADYKVRPNQLMLTYIPFEDGLVDMNVEAYIVKNSVSELLFPYGICSLSQNHEYFHPYHDRNPRFHKDAAYHNGTIWGWNAGMAVTGLTKFGYQELAYDLTKNLSNQILNYGTRGSMSECLDAFPNSEGDITLTGTFSQAWSVSEFTRNGYQDYAGFLPNLIENKIMIKPAIPTDWRKYTSIFSFGKEAKFNVKYRKYSSKQIFILSHNGYDKAVNVEFCPQIGKERKIVNINLRPRRKAVVIVDTKRDKIYVNCRQVQAEQYMDSFEEIIGELEFQEPNINGTFPVLENDNYLINLIVNGEFE